jgi:hypothetical protein
MRSNTGGRVAKDAPAWRCSDTIAARPTRLSDRSRFCRRPRPAHRRCFGWLPAGPVGRNALPAGQRPASPAPIIRSQTIGGPLSRTVRGFRFKAVGVFAQPFQDRRERRGFPACDFGLAECERRLDFRDRSVHRVLHGTNVGRTGQNVEKAITRIPAAGAPGDRQENEGQPLFSSPWFVHGA